MSWYDDTFENRWPIMSDGSVDTEWQIAIPSNWDWFWDNVQDTTNGYDIVICQGDGETLLTFDLSGFNHSTKTCTIRWNDTATGSTHTVWWIYWNKASPSDLSGSPTTATPQTALISLVDPLSNADTLDLGPERPGSTAPAKEIQKVPGEAKMVWARLPPSLSMDRMHGSAGSQKLYEVGVWSFFVFQAGADASLDTPSGNRIVEDREGNTWVGAWLTLIGWTDGDDYTGQIAVLLGSASNEVGVTIQTNFIIRSRDASEA